MERGLWSDWVILSCGAYQGESDEIERFVFRYGLLILCQNEKPGCGAEGEWRRLWPQRGGLRGAIDPSMHVSGV
jgi:hypothetical protein